MSKDKRSKHRHRLGWLWKLLGRCWHCGSKDIAPHYQPLAGFGGAIAGKYCKHCGYIT